MFRSGVEVLEWSASMALHKLGIVMDGFEIPTQNASMALQAQRLFRPVRLVTQARTTRLDHPRGNTSRGAHGAGRPAASPL